MSPAGPPDLDHQVAALLAGEPKALADPHRVYRAVRERGRAHAHRDVVLLTSYQDVKWALEATHLLSSRGLVEGSRIESARSQMAGEARDAFDEVITFQSHFASRNDGADHARLRRIAHRAFTPRRIGMLRESATRYVDLLLDRMAEMAEPDAMLLASELPLMMVIDLLGVAQSDREQIHHWSLSLSASNGSTEPAAFLAARDATRAFNAYVAEQLAGHRRSSNRTDLVVALMHAEDGERLSSDELAAMFVQLLFAGHETTAGLIGIGLFELLKDRNQWTALVDDPTLIPHAVEELLRVVSPSQFASRVAIGDFEIDDTLVPEGRTVIAVIAAANRDPEVFPRPDRVDVHRANVRQHIGFGFGPHFCLGAALARLEAEIALTALCSRFPAVQLVDEDIRWGGGAMLRHVSALPVRLGPDRSARSG